MQLSIIYHLLVALRADAPRAIVEAWEVVVEGGRADLPAFLAVVLVACPAVKSDEVGVAAAGGVVVAALERAQERGERVERAELDDRAHEPCSLEPVAVAPQPVTLTRGAKRKRGGGAAAATAG